VIFCLIENTLCEKRFCIYLSHFLSDHKELNSLGRMIEHNYCPSNSKNKNLREMKACSTCEVPLECFPSSKAYPIKSHQNIFTDFYSYGLHNIEVTSFFNKK
jgi:signal recognition particle subunit SEC65